MGLLTKSCKSVSPVLLQCVSEMSEQLSDYTPFITNGVVHLCGGSEKSIKILRDTGASQSLILSDVLNFCPESYTGSSILIRSVTGHLTILLHKVILSSELVSGEVVLGVCSAFPMEGVSLILGNDLCGPRVTSESILPVLVDNPLVSDKPDVAGLEFPEAFTSCAVTLAMAAKRRGKQGQDKEETSSLCDLSGTFFHNLETPEQPDKESVGPVKENVGESDIGHQDANGKDNGYHGTPVEAVSELPAFETLLSVSRVDFIVEQQADPTLKSLFHQVDPGEKLHDQQSEYFLQEDLLCRKWVVKNDSYSNEVIQVVVPLKFREAVLKVSHDGVAVHTGVRKTYNRVMRAFFWSRLRRFVALFIKTCHTCQVTGKPNQKIPVAPLYPTPALSPPFQHLIVDCVGPLPCSKAGHCYLLTVMCQSTRYPEAYPLRSITTRSVLKALIGFM